MWKRFFRLGTFKLAGANGVLSGRFFSIIQSDRPSGTINQVYLWLLQGMSDRKTIKSFDYAIMIIDLADEILEFTNLVVVTLFFPFLPPWDIYDDLLYL